MPTLVIRGIDPHKLVAGSSQWIETLADICDCGTDNFTIEFVQSIGLAPGRLVHAYPFIEVGWFDRGKETRDRFAFACSEFIRSAGIEEAEIVFVDYDPQRYYINGKPCG